MIIIKNLITFNSECKVIFLIESLIITNKKIFLLHSNDEHKKNIFIETIAGIYQNFSGQIIIDDFIIERYTERQFAQKIQSTDSKGTLFNQVTIFKQFLYVLNEHNPSTEKFEEIIYTEFKKIKKTELLFSYPHTLSLFEKIIISIAQKIILKPKYLLLDHPSENLNKEEKIILFYYLLDFQKQGGTLIINSNDDYLKNFFYNKELILL